MLAYELGTAPEGRSTCEVGHHGTGRSTKAVTFKQPKRLVAGRVSEFRGQQDSNRVPERLVGEATNGTRAMLRKSNLPTRFWAEAVTTSMSLRNNEDEQGDNTV